MRPFLVLSANTPWVYALAQNLALDTQVTALQIYDFSNYRRIKPNWPEQESPVRRLRIVMAPGYAGKLEPVFRPLMRGIFRSERSRLTRATGEAPLVIAPYPYLTPWLRSFPGQDLIYYNLDNYDLYRPDRAHELHALEDELIARASLTLCLSVYQVERLSQRNPVHAPKIRHFPLGVVDAFLNPAPETAPLPATVGYVGNLGDRVDWGLVAQTARLLPDVTFHMVGTLVGPSEVTAMNTWQRARAEALDLENVIYAGSVPQENVREHYWRYAVNWMPYDRDHMFNKAACPTKIMDALASGRPFVSTEVPEVRLYPERIAVVDGAELAAQAIRRAISLPPDPGEQVAFARRHTWERRAETFLSLLGETAARPSGAAKT